MTEWYKASQYPDDTTSKKVYNRLFAAMGRHNLSLSVRRVKLGDRWIVLAHSEAAPPAQVEQEIASILSGGTPVTLPANFLNELAQRRQEKTRDRKRGQALAYESHTPTHLGKLGYYTPKDQPELMMSPDEVQDALADDLDADELYKLFKPLLEIIPAGAEDRFKAIYRKEAEGMLAWGVSSGYLLWARTHPGEKPTRAQMQEWIAQAERNKLAKTDEPGHSPPKPSIILDARDERPVAAPRTNRPFTGLIDKVTGDSPLKPGQKITMRSLPFIIGYQMISQAETRNTYEGLAGGFPSLPGRTADELTALIQRVNAACLHSARKYIFTESALRMHGAVFQADETGWIAPSGHIWIEPYTAIDTPYGERVKAVYASLTWPVADIRRVMQHSGDKRLEGLLNSIYEGFSPYWTLEIINERCKLIYDLTYDMERGAWVYLASHLCPEKQCEYVEDADITTATPGLCIPCNRCKEAVHFWAAWLHTSMRMIRGDFAVSPEPAPFQVEAQEYEQTERVTVGKGKNKRSMSQEVRRQVDYTIVSYDVSIRPHREAADEMGDETAASESEKRASWLTLHDSADIIYERKTIPDHTRRFPVRRNGTRQTGRVSVHHNEPKYIPMLKPEARRAQTIKRVTARQYEGR
jgi:hypothetical protein